MPELLVAKPVLRNGTLVWRGEREVTVLDARGLRRLPADWLVDRIELASDGGVVLAFGDRHRRAQVWEAVSGARVLTITGQERVHSLHGGLAVIEAVPYAFTATRDATISILDLRDNSTRGWLSVTGYVWFQVDRVIGLGPTWLAVVGHRVGEQYDTVVVLSARIALNDPMAIVEALTERSVNEWGYSVAVGPLSDDGAVIFRDPEWSEDDEAPDDPAAAFCGLVLYDLSRGEICERIPHEAIPTGATIGGDATRVAIEHADHVELIARGTGGATRTVEAIALDPFRMEVARVVDGAIEIAPLPE